MARASAVANTGKYFKNWSVGGVFVSNSPLALVITNANTNLTALFANLPANTFALNVLASGTGTVTRNLQQPYYTNGQSVTLTPTPDGGQTFIAWSGNASGTLNPLAVLMDGNKTITATFAPNGATLLPPFVALTNPPSGAQFTAPATVSLAASASDSDGTVTNVAFYRGNTLLGSDASSPFEFVWTGVPAGTYSLTAVASDNSGLSSTSAPVSLTVAPPNQSPLVSILSPTNGSSFIAGTNISLTSSAADLNGSVARVEFFHGGTNLIGVSSNGVAGQFSFVWSNVPAGAYSLTAVAFDNQGASAVSAAVAISVGSANTNAPVFSFATNSYFVPEAQAVLVLTVLKSPGSGAALVNYATAEGSAKSSGAFPDFTAAQGVLNFGAGELSKTFTIAIHEDQAWESNQFFTVTLTPGQGAQVLAGADLTTVTILDNDLGTTNSITQPLSPGSPESPLSSLRVHVLLSLPPNGTAPGQWRFTWELDWRDGGTLASNLPGGRYEVEFRPVNGYAEPGRTPLPVLAGTNQVETFYYTNTGVAQAGSLAVTLLPGSVGPGAGWRRVNEAVYHASGETVDSLPVGSYTLEFNPVAGWVEPGRRVVTVEVNRVKSVTAQYGAANPGAGTLPSPVSFAGVTPFGPNQPYTFLGQILSDAGWGSGWVAKERVVLTAAHVVYDDVQFSFLPVGSVKWFFQRHAGTYEPAPKLPRGWVVLSGYADRRVADATPGFSSVASQNRDVAALYFYEPAGRRSAADVPGGYGGYLVSRPGESGQEWLFNSNFKTLAGYPVEGRDAANNPVVPGRIYGTSLGQPAFTTVSNRVYGTLNLQGLPGMSGGPLCVQFLGSPGTSFFFPAAVYLGGSQQTLVRLIDEEVAGLIISAEIAGDAGENNTGGGPVRLSPGQGASSSIYGFVTVHLLPAAVTNFGAAYLFRNPVTLEPSDYYTQQTNLFAFLGNDPVGWKIEFTAIPGHIAPMDRTFKELPSGLRTNFFANYQAYGGLEALPDSTNALLLGSSGSLYRIEQRLSLGGAAGWSLLRTQRLTSSSALVTNAFPPGTTNRFLRAVLQP